MDEELIRRAVAVNWHNLALGHEVFQTAGAFFVRNRSLPSIYDANFVFGMTASEPHDIDRLLTATHDAYAHARRVTFRIDPFTPPAFEARLALDGYSRSEAIVLVLSGELHTKPTRCDTRPIETDADWHIYMDLKRLDWQEHAARIGVAPSAAVADGLFSSSRLKCPPVQYVLAYDEGQPAGFCSTWKGTAGVGQIEDLFVHPAHRHRGLATALIDRCVATARRQGAGPMAIVADINDTPKEMYAALGWVPVAVCRQYGKDIFRSVALAGDERTGSAEKL